MVPLTVLTTVRLLFDCGLHLIRQWYDCGTNLLQLLLYDCDATAGQMCYHCGLLVI